MGKKNKFPKYLYAVAVDDEAFLVETTPHDAAGTAEKESETLIGAYELVAVKEFKTTTEFITTNNPEV